MKPISELSHPIQPVGLAPDGFLRFKKNEIVCLLLDIGPHDMNSLAMKGFSREDREQFAQLIGYSLSGFGELGYVSDETYETAERMTETGEPEDKARIAVLQENLQLVKDKLAEIIPLLFPIHPDDLTP